MPEVGLIHLMVHKPYCGVWGILWTVCVGSKVCCLHALTSAAGSQNVTAAVYSVHIVVCGMLTNMK